MSAFLFERFPPDTDTDRDRDDGEPDDYDTSDLRRQRPKIRRCRLTAHQLQTLNHVFEQDTQPSMEARIALGAQLGMETKQVSAWFQNKRQKLKNAPLAPFPSSPVPSSSHHRDIDSRPPHQQTIHLAQPIYHSRDLPPPPEYHPHQQSYSSYPHHHSQRHPFAIIDHEPNYVDRYPYQYHDRYDMKPSSTTYQLPPASHLLAAPHDGHPDGQMMTRSRSVSSRSSVAGTEYTGTTESVPSPDSYTDYLTKTASFMPPASDKGTTKGVARIMNAAKTKKEPAEEEQHSLVMRVPSPPPEAVQHAPTTTTTTKSGNRRTSNRARSARLASSPIVATRNLSSNASNAGDGHQKRLTRSRMSASQRSYLHGIYEKNPEPTMAERQMIADKLGVQIGKITNWFRNLRQSVRRGKLLDAKLGQHRGGTVDSSRMDEDEDDEEMDIEEDHDHHHHSDVDADTRASPSPVPTGIVPGKGAYSTRFLIAASEYVLHSPASFYAEEDDEEEEEEAHEAVTPHPSPEAKVSHSFEPAAPAVNVNTTTPDNLNDNMLASPSPRVGISLPSISITLAQSEEKQRPARKFRSAVEDALLLLHFRQNCDVREIHNGVVGRSSSPTLF